MINSFQKRTHYAYSQNNATKIFDLLFDIVSFFIFIYLFFQDFKQVKLYFRVNILFDSQFSFILTTRFVESLTYNPKIFCQAIQNLLFACLNVDGSYSLYLIGIWSSFFIPIQNHHFLYVNYKSCKSSILILKIHLFLIEWNIISSWQSHNHRSYT